MPVILVTGNHEAMLIDVLDGRHDLETWTTHGGDRTLESYGIDQPSRMPDQHIGFLRTAKAFHETETHGFVHASYYPNNPLKDTPTAILHWEFLDPQRAWPHYSNRTIIVGHTPQTSGKILDLGFLVGIDTDASRGGWLTALDTTTGNYWQANQLGEIREGNR